MRKTWRYTRRKINGRMRDVKVKRKTDGNYIVRIVGSPNRTDSFYYRK